MLLTGATGFLGSRVAIRIVESGRFGVIVAKRSMSSTERLGAIAGKVSFWDLDLADPEPLFQQGQVDIIVHIATEYGLAVETIAQVVRTNLELPIRLLELAAKYQARGFLSTDSYFTKIEGSYSHLPAYVLSKKTLQPWLTYFGGLLPVANLVLEHVYGPGDRPTKFVQSALEAIVVRQDERFPMTSGMQERDFIYIEDVVEAYLAMIDYIGGTEPGYLSVDIGSGVSTTVLGFAQEMKRQSGSATELLIGALATRSNEFVRSVGNSLFLRKLGWEPAYSLERGIGKLIQESRGVKR